MRSTASSNPRPDTAKHPSQHVRLGLAREIARLITERGLTQVEAAGLVGATQPNMSAILAGKVDGLSVERLMRILNALDHDVHLVVLPKTVRARPAMADVLTAWPQSTAKAVMPNA